MDPNKASKDLLAQLARIRITYDGGNVATVMRNVKESNPFYAENQISKSVGKVEAGLASKLAKEYNNKDQENRVGRI